LLILGGLIGAVTVALMASRAPDSPEPAVAEPANPPPRPRRDDVDDGGYSLAIQLMRPWGDGTSLDEVRTSFDRAGARHLAGFDALLTRPGQNDGAKLECHLARATLLLYEGEAEPAYAELARARALVEGSAELSGRWLSTVIFLQGVAGLRAGELDNCVMCRGEGTCIFPISREAAHTKPTGARRAVRHFTEYLGRHPDDLSSRWLVNIAHMTLAEYPDRVPPAHLIAPEQFRSEFDIGRFRNVAYAAGVARLNQAGGAIMEDFDGDGRLDLVITSWDPAMPMAVFRNTGDGTFEDRSKDAGVADQLGGLYCVQTDYDNDGRPDVLVVRGAWWQWPIRPSLLRNNGDGTFADVTAKAGLLRPTNAISAAWADYDNDGRLDLCIGAERGPNLLYRNTGDGTFEEVATAAGVAGHGETCKGVNWGDFDGDGFPDLFLSCVQGPHLYRNNRDGTFTDVSAAAGVTGPRFGFSCWFWDFDNDGRLDLFVNAYERSLDDVVRGLLRQPTAREVGRLYRNAGGRFEDVTKAAGLDLVTYAMGSNFADFDNDGYPDFYLGTGGPRYSALVPNRMFRNVGGTRFAEVTTSSGTGHLQKGHAVACGDWDRDGSVDVFIDLGGATPGDRANNALFQNPGQGNHWLTVKLVGVKTNRAAVGARIKAVPAAGGPPAVFRHVTSGSSFGANPLQQTLGLGGATRVARLEVYWPTSGTTQVFHDVAADQAIEVTEFATEYRRLGWSRLPQPK
jgi:hypothetical protein